MKSTSIITKNKKIMKIIILIYFPVAVLVFGGCKKSSTSPTPPIPGTPTCQLKSETTNLLSNGAKYEYGFDAKGKITTIKKYIGGSFHLLNDSIVIGDNTIVRYFKSNGGANMIQTTVYNQSFVDGKPTEAEVSLQEGSITQTNIYHYFFFYDSKNRLIKVGEQTDHVIGDFEYDLSIGYDDKDNVTALSYAWTTGPNTTTTVTASGYDSKPTPFGGIKNWYFFMHAAWDNYDPEPVLTALSKHNPLGYTMPDGFKRTISYVYNDKGFPTKRMNTNTNTSGATYSFDETFDYQCK
jgi:hypothetical protein